MKQSITNLLSERLKSRQQDCDHVSFFVEGKVFEELKGVDVAKHNCLHLINVLAKLENEEEELIKTEVIPDLLIYALQIGYAFNQDPLSLLQHDEESNKHDNNDNEEESEVNSLEELKIKFSNQSKTTFPETVAASKRIITYATAYLARICDKEDHGTALPKDDISINVSLPLLKASLLLSTCLQVNLDDIYQQRIEQIKSKYGNVRVLLGKRNNPFEISGPAKLPTKQGEWQLYGFKDIIAGQAVEAAALILGDINEGDNVLVRFHSQCITSEVLRSLRCDCNEQLDSAIQDIINEGRGMIIYTLEEGRGIGLHNKIAAYTEQDKGKDTIDANIAIGQPVEGRTFKLEAKIVQYFRLKSIKLITNNPDKIKAARDSGTKISEILATDEPNQPHSRKYTQTKRNKLQHSFK